jgi:hypothetical protein
VVELNIDSLKYRQVTGGVLMVETGSKILSLLRYVHGVVNTTAGTAWGHRLVSGSWLPAITDFTSSMLEFKAPLIRK